MATARSAPRLPRSGGVKVKDGDVTLTGDVLSRQDKRRAEDIAESILGIGNVENRIRVRTESAATTRLNEIDSTK
jgi:hypothetical protein